MKTTRCYDFVDVVRVINNNTDTIVKRVSGLERWAGSITKNVSAADFKATVAIGIGIYALLKARSLYKEIDILNKKVKALEEEQNSFLD